MADLSTDFTKDLGFIYTFAENDKRIDDDFRIGDTNIFLPAADTAVKPPLKHSFWGLDIQGQIMEVDFGVFSARLQAAIGRGQGELLARPRILTACNVTANIHTGQDYPYLSRKIGGNSIVLTSDYVRTGVEMNVTPGIVWNEPGPGDDFIELALDVKVDFVSRFILDSGLAQPIVSTRDYKGSVIIKDNHTIGIGGLYREDISKSKSTIPVVGNIPYFGNLFTNRNEGKSKSELVVFVTARIDRNVEYEIRAMEAARAAVQSATGEGGP